MSNCHEGVSCDQCSKSNFQGNRYKCLICFDFDLCSDCFNSNTNNNPNNNNTTTNNNNNILKSNNHDNRSAHSNSHPMQCILTRTDYELFYGPGSLIEYIDQLSFTCPYCGKIGLSEVTLATHINQVHMSNETQPLTNNEVICPICAVLSSVDGGDPNHLTDDLVNHLNQEHLEPFSLEPAADTLTLRDIGLTSNMVVGGGSGSSASTASAVAAAAALRFSRRFNPNPLSNSSSTTTAATNAARSTLSRQTSARYQTLPDNSLTSFMRSSSNVFDAFVGGGGGARGAGSTSSSLGSGIMIAADPIAELLSQLAGVRRAAANNTAPSSISSSLQHLQSQLIRERDNLQQLVSIAAAAANNTTTTSTNSLSSSATTLSSRLNNMNTSSNTSNANKLIHKIGTIHQNKTNLNNQNNQNINDQSQNNLITNLLNQTLELPQNIFQQALPPNARDPKLLLSKYDFSTIDHQQQQQSNKSSKINPLAQSLFINDLMLSLLVNQMSTDTSIGNVDSSNNRSNSLNNNQLKTNESIIEEILVEQQISTHEFNNNERSNNEDSLSNQN